MLRRIIAHCRRYEGPELHRSLSQAALSLAIFFALVGVMIALAGAGLWYVSLPISIVAGGVLVKLFTIQHDCGHGSYFENRRAANALGFFISLLTFTPYGFWRDAHNRHHASSGDLERRGIGAVDTLTVEEYRALPPAKRFLYRAYRNPLVLILVGAPFYFLVMQRLPLCGPMPFTEVYSGLKLEKIWKSVMALNIGLVVFYGALMAAFGVWPVLIAVVPTMTVAAWAGTWLFFVQHQYEDAYWAEKPEWNFAEAAIFGSSHYELPKVLRWFTGNIGLHHIHHLASRIPNYRLPECFRSSRELLALPRMNMRESLACARLALWDRAQRKMIPFSALSA